MGEYKNRLSEEEIQELIRFLMVVSDAGFYFDPDEEFNFIVKKAIRLREKLDL